VRVIVHADATVEVVLPQRAREREADEAVVQFSAWISRRLQDVTALRARTATPAGTVPYLGELLTLRPEAGRTRVHRRGDVLLVPDTETDEALERWYRRQAKAEIAPRLDAAATAVGRSYTTLSIRNQRTRWGSCSSSGAMSFNWRLLLAPPDVLDYVVVHEACHLVHLDHSSRFWALVARQRPQYRVQQRWLAANGAGLHLPAADQPPSARANAA
jgi:predicted metal-dependent hydrolase